MQWTDGSFFPIHLAALHNESPAFCQTLLDAYPDLEKEDVYHGTALFNACIQHPNNRLDTVRYLFDVYPEAIELVQTASRKAPLECALSNREERAGEQDKQENERVICFLDIQLEYVQKSKDSQALAVQDCNGRLPLHHALLNNASLGSVKLLVKGNPAALQVADNHGTLPLHIACEFCSVDVVEFLVEPFDGCLKVSDVKKNLPLHYACRGGNCGVVKYLLEKQAAPVSARNVDDKLPICLLCECDENNVDTKKTVYTETIWRLLLAHPETLMNW